MMAHQCFHFHAAQCPSQRSCYHPMFALRKPEKFEKSNIKKWKQTAFVIKEQDKKAKKT